MPLTTTGLVCRYYFDGAASGQTPTQIDDASPNGYHLTTLNYGGSNLNFVDTSGNRGLESTATTGTQRASRAIDNTSDALRTAMEGVQKATLALVLRVDGAASGGGRIFGINGRAGQNGELILKATSATNFQVAWNDANVSSPVFNFAARSVLHLVIDTTQATQAARVRYSIDGGALTNVANTIALNSTLALGSNLDLICFNRESSGAFDRSFDGVLYYAALHSVDLTQTEIDNDYPILSADDDAPSGAATLVADAGTFTLAGPDVVFIAPKRLVPEPGAFVLTGADALRDFAMAAAPATFALAGHDAGLALGGADPALTAEAAAIALTGQAVAMRLDRRMAGEIASFGLSGTPAGLGAARALPAAAVAVTLGAQEAALLYSGSAKVMPAASGGFTLTGSVTNARAARVVAAAGRALALDGDVASLNYAPRVTEHILQVAPGVITLAGMPVQLQAPNRGEVGGKKRRLSYEDLRELEADEDLHDVVRRNNQIIQLVTAIVTSGALNG